MKKLIQTAMLITMLTPLSANATRKKSGKERERERTEIAKKVGKSNLVTAIIDAKLFEGSNKYQKRKAGQLARLWVRADMGQRGFEISQKLMDQSNKEAVKLHRVEILKAMKAAGVVELGNNLRQTKSLSESGKKLVEIAEKASAGNKEGGILENLITDKLKNGKSSLNIKKMNAFLDQIKSISKRTLEREDLSSTTLKSILDILGIKDLEELLKCF